MILRAFVVGILTFGLCISLWVASSNGAEISGGLKLGGGTTELSDVPLDSGTGVIAGLFATIRINSLLAFQAEGLYAQRGAKDLVIHYLEFPLLARLDLSLGGLGVYALGGVSLAFLQNCTDCNQYVWWLEDDELSLVPADSLRINNVPPEDDRIVTQGLKLDSTSMEGVLGAGLGVGLGGGTIGLEGRYQTSLGDLNAHTNPVLTDLSIKNEGIAVLLSYSWRFGGEDDDLDSGDDLGEEP